MKRFIQLIIFNIVFFRLAQAEISTAKYISDTPVLKMLFENQRVSNFEGLVLALFNLSIKVGAIFLVFAIAYFGIMIMLSNQPNELSNYKNKIFGSIFGLLLLIGSVSILEFVNPELVKIKALTKTKPISESFELDKETKKIIQTNNNRRDESLNKCLALDNSSGNNENTAIGQCGQLAKSEKQCTSRADNNSICTPSDPAYDQAQCNDFRTLYRQACNEKKVATIAKQVWDTSQAVDKKMGGQQKGNQIRKQTNEIFNKMNEEQKKKEKQNSQLLNPCPNDPATLCPPKNPYPPIDNATKTSALKIVLLKCLAKMTDCPDKRAIKGQIINSLGANTMTEKEKEAFADYYSEQILGHLPKN